MSHGKITFDVDGQAVGPGQSAREIDEYADLRGRAVGVDRQAPDLVGAGHRQVEVLLVRRENEAVGADRKSVVEGKSVSVRVDLGGRRYLKKNKKQTHQNL